MARFLFLGMFFLLANVSAGNNDLKSAKGSLALQNLIKMSKAMKSLNYQGTVVFLRNGKLETMKYFHAAKNGAEQERLSSLNSPLREVIRSDSRVSCYFKSKQQIIVDYRPFENSFLIDIPKTIDLSATKYNFETAGEENIAMRPTTVIVLQPKDNFRYLRKIWLEKDNYLPLKAVIYDFSGQPLEQFIFTEIEVKESIPFVDVNLWDEKWTLIEKSGPSVVSPKADNQNQAIFLVDNAPEGFQQIFFTRSAVHNSDQLVDHMILGDGFSSVSVYMENKNTNLQTGPQSIGAVNSYSRIIGDFELTVMGEVPAETVKQIAEGVRLRGTAH